MQQCPICYNELEVRDCSPCDCCGWDDNEIDHLNAQKHTYKVYDIYKGLHLTLCNFCEVDFSSYNPEYFGLLKDERLGLHKFNYVKDIKNPQIIKDKFCPNCSERLSFLKFLKQIREIADAREF
jgi:hypothetical protein